MPKDNLNSWTHASAVVLTNEDGLILTVSRGRGSNDWNLPGGKAEGDETPEETAIREVREETGLDIFDLESVYSRFDEGRPVHVFMADWGGEIRPSDEGDVKWAPIDTILQPSSTFSKFNRKLFRMLKENWSEFGYETGDETL